jgi:hypothetical protein
LLKPSTLNLGAQPGLHADLRFRIDNACGHFIDEMLQGVTAGNA